MKEYRIVEITQDARTLGVERGFLIVRQHDNELGRIELDTISAVICNANYTILSTPVLNKLAQCNIPLVICDKKTKVPTSTLIGLDNNWRQADVFQAQAKSPIPKNKYIWQSLVKAKLEQQAMVLKYFDKSQGYERLLAYSKRVKSADSENLEAQGAAYYWRELMGLTFRRNRYAEDINILFNYGYTILRATTLRCICASGLHPSLGVHHCSTTNTYRLADDLIEPFRPFVDLEVKSIENTFETTLTVTNKKRLSGLINKKYYKGGQSTSIANMIYDTSTQLAKYYLDERKDFNVKSVKYKYLNGQEDAT